MAQLVREGRLDVDSAAAKLGVAAGEIERWVASPERAMTVAEVLASPAEIRLARRAERLVALIAAADAVIRGLNELLDAECKKFGRFTQQASPS